MSRQISTISAIFFFLVSWVAEGSRRELRESCDGSWGFLKLVRDRFGLLVCVGLCRWVWGLAFWRFGASALGASGFGYRLGSVFYLLRVRARTHAPRSGAQFGHNGRNGRNGHVGRIFLRARGTYIVVTCTY
jgi:hypothetical protein